MTNVIVVCKYCEKKYALGMNGTVDGCDVCLEIIRNLDGQVIDEEDSLTDMEKS